MSNNTPPLPPLRHPCACGETDPAQFDVRHKTSGAPTLAAMCKACRRAYQNQRYRAPQRRRQYEAWKQRVGKTRSYQRWL